MKKKIIYIFMLAAVAAALPGCSSDFLDTKSSTDLGDAQVFEDTGTARGALYGIYKMMRSWGCTPHVRMDCCGLHTNLLTFDVMATDITMRSATWYFYDYDYWHTGDETVFKTDHFWQFYYVVINNCNGILVNLSAAKGPQSEKEAIEAETRALRAFAYSHLIQLYQHTYVIANDKPGVPIYEKPATGDLENNPRASVEKVYELITSDLKRALELFPANGSRESKYYIDRNVAAGILARVYLTMGKWADAAQMASAARSGYPLMSPQQWTEGFNNLSNPEWIWGIHQTSDQNVGWGSTFSILDYQRGDQKTFRISSQLADTYSATDVRGGLIVKQNDNLLGNGKFREPASINLGQMVLMRSSEMVLIEAEAAVRQDDDPSARTLLFEVQSRRDASAVKSSSSGEALLEEILLERRKELWAEGFGLFDMLRNQKPLERTGDHVSLKSYPANSWNFIFQIPRAELDVNKGINDEDQNPNSGVYIK